MKTLKTITASALTVIFLSATVFATTAAAEGITIETKAAKSDIKKVVVRGNLKVVIVQSKSEKVTIDENDQSDVRISQVGNTLTLASSVNRPVTLTVYVKDIFRIDAADKAIVNTSGSFNVKYLQVFLKDNATARVNANTESLYTLIDGKANLELLGKSEQHIMQTKGLASLNTEKFAALVTESLPSEAEIAMK